MPREYTRALNSTKLERVFAKPFIGSLDGHKDGVHCLSKHPLQLNMLLSGACDGEIKIWNLTTRKCVQTYVAHEGFVRGICMNPSASMFFSCGNDKIVKYWKYDLETSTAELEPVQTIVGKTFYTAIDHHWKKPIYATSGERIDIWDEGHLEPIKSYSWGVDSHYTVKFNPIEYNVLASSAADRSLVLYDIRQSVPLRKVTLEMSTNAICWNPLEAMIFTVANEDHNLYTFDMRKMSEPVQVHMDHTAAVMSLDYSPTGKEFCSASYDKTIRIFEAKNGRSRDVYHTKRMQHVMAIKWSSDSKYLLSGSDEMNIRIWKAQAAESAETAREGAGGVQREVEGQVQILPGDQAHQASSSLAKDGVQRSEGETNHEGQSPAQGGQQARSQQARQGAICVREEEARGQRGRVDNSILSSGLRKKNTTHNLRQCKA